MGRYGRRPLLFLLRRGLFPALPAAERGEVRFEIAVGEPVCLAIGDKHVDEFLQFAVVTDAVNRQGQHEDRLAGAMPDPFEHVLGFRGEIDLALHEFHLPRGGRRRRCLLRGGLRDAAKSLERVFQGGQRGPQFLDRVDGGGGFHRDFNLVGDAGLGLQGEERGLHEVALRWVLPPHAPVGDGVKAVLGKYRRVKGGHGLLDIEPRYFPGMRTRQGGRDGALHDAARFRVGRDRISERVAGKRVEIENGDLADVREFEFAGLHHRQLENGGCAPGGENERRQSRSRILSKAFHGAGC